MISVQRLGPETKIQTLCSLLRDLAYRLGPTAKLPTANELCSLFSTSRTTLNDALDILESQNVVLRKRGSGIYVSPKLYSKCIYVLLYSHHFIAKSASPFWGMLWGLFAQEVERRVGLKDENFQFHMILQSPGDGIGLPDHIIHDVQSGNVHGVLAVGMYVQTMQWLAAHNVPSVGYAGVGTRWVTGDIAEMVRMGVTSLAEQGCQRIGWWTNSIYRKDEDNFSNATENVFRPALTKHDLVFEPDLIHYHYITENSADGDKKQTYQEEGYRYALEVFGDPTTPKPDGLVIDNDMITAGAVIALQRLGVKIGRDVKIASHANFGSPVLFGYDDEMTLIEFDPADLVKEMFHSLDALLAGETFSEPGVLIKPRVKGKRP